MAKKSLVNVARGERVVKASSITVKLGIRTASRLAAVLSDLVDSSARGNYWAEKLSDQIFNALGEDAVAFDYAIEPGAVQAGVAVEYPEG